MIEKMVVGIRCDGELCNVDGHRMYAEIDQPLVMAKEFPDNLFPHLPMGWTIANTGFRMEIHCPKCSGNTKG